MATRPILSYEVIVSEQAESENDAEVSGARVDPPVARVDDDEPVPKLPRGRGFKFSSVELFRIGFTLITLVAVMLMARPCARAVSGFVMSMDGSGSAKTKAALPKPGTVDVPAATPEKVPEQQYERLRPGMSDEEVKAAIERSKARAAGSGHTP